MTRLFNDPNDFVSDMSRGFALASSRWVQAVPGGMVRSTRSSEPTVALVIGGGSGHFPAFSGLVGPGLAHGTAMGNVFASPSTQQILSVARSCDQGRGIIFSYGNYAGDVLNFNQAQDILRQEGVDVRTIVVTDDIFSASKGEIEKRRGIAGDLVVFKVAGAAAEAGLGIAEAERLARSANERTRSIGVAFSGCTLPGSDEPLFTVPAGAMAIGLGIHGEPGIDEIPMPTASQLAELLVSHLLAEAPNGSGRVVPILNGLGTVKYEELYLLYGLIDPLLKDAGLEVVDPEVGEFCTSFDMAGLSLTLLWLDDKLSQLWSAPCSSAAFTRGELGTSQLVNNDLVSKDLDGVDTNVIRTERPVPVATAESQRLGGEISAAVAEIAEALAESAGELGRLDRIAGDGDHGIGMQRGSQAAANAAEAAFMRGSGAAGVLSDAGEAWANAGGGTSGAIWGRIIANIARGFVDSTGPTPSSVAMTLSKTFADIRRFGEVELGDKTLVDALGPFADEFARIVESPTPDTPDTIDATDDAANHLRIFTAAFSHGADAARAAADATAGLIAKRGRSRAHGDKSLGTPDPGAVSLALIARALADHLGAQLHTTTTNTI